MLDRLRETLDGLIEQHRASALARDKLHSYKDAVLRMLGDLHPTGRELAALEGQQRAFMLDPQRVAAIHHEVFRELAAHVLALGSVTADEIQGLGAVASVLHVAWTDLPPSQLRAFQVAETIVEIQNGRLPALTPGQTRINARAGEVVHAEVPCRLLDERIYHEYISQSSGVTFRIARGVYHHSETTHGKSIPHTEIVPVDTGALSITSKRVAFVGARQNFSVPWANVLHAEALSNGVAIGFADRRKTALLQYLSGSDDGIVAALIAHYLA